MTVRIDLVGGSGIMGVAAVSRERSAISIGMMRKSYKRPTLDDIDGELWE